MLRRTSNLNPTRRLSVLGDLGEYASLVICRQLHCLISKQNEYSDFLQRCAKTSNPAHGRVIHAKCVKGSVPFSVFLQNHLLNMYVKCGDLSNGLQLFDELPHKNVVSWSAVISGLVQCGYAEKGLSLFSTMHSEGLTIPNEHTFVGVLQACSLSENLMLLYQIYGLIVRMGFQSNVFLVNAFLTALLKNGKFTEAVQFFENCPDKDIVSWNAMTSGYLKFSFMEVPGFWCRMNHLGVKPDNYTFVSVLTGLAALSHVEMGVQVHTHLVKSGHGNEVIAGNALLDMYTKSQKLSEGLKAFDEMPVKDVCSWTHMVYGYLQIGEPRKALEFTVEMMKHGVNVNKFTLATALNACSSLACLEEGKQLHGLKIKLGDDMDTGVDNALLDMYAKCGYMDTAYNIFRSMTDPSVITWTSLIMGWAQNGKSREALDTFDQMRLEGFEPNYITFISVLYACSQGGFIDEAWTHFSSMSFDHGIIPGEDHYACMVNLLGRSGLIKEAEELIRAMPFQAGSLLWQTLLGACLVHGDVETGKRAAELAIQQEQRDSSTYVLLSNLLADLSNWDGVGILRELMNLRYVKKVTGSSWVALEK